MRGNMLFVLALLLSPMSEAADARPSSATLFAATFIGLDGKPVNLAQLRGKVAVVNFWATWCPPCRKEMPDLEAVYAKFRPQGIVFVGIAVEDDPVAVREFSLNHAISFPLAMGKNTGIELMLALGNTVAGLPYTVVLNSQGKIVAAHRGPFNPSNLEQALQKVIRASEAGTE